MAKKDLTIAHKSVGVAPNASLNKIAVVIAKAKNPITTPICSKDVF